MLLLLLLINIHPSASFQQPSLSFKTHHPHQSDTIRLHANKQTYLYDGGELQSFFINNKPSDNNVISLPRGGVDTVGYVTFVASSTLIGIQAVDQDINSSTVETSTIDNEVVYSDTIATIPRGISENDAISTAAASLVGIHCAGPKITGVGGSGDVGFYSGRAVVVGGNEYACFLAEGLAALGLDTSIVSSGSVKLNNGQGVKVMRPAVTLGKEDDEIGFTTAIGQFDSLIDTIANERKESMPDDTGSSVIQLLLAKHECDTYTSTLSTSQQIIKKNGVIFGPGKANAHAKSLEAMNLQRCIPLVPSPGFGTSTLQVLLDKKVIYPSKSNKAIVTRGWSMKDFWEETSWPRDSNGSGIRFGMPVVEEEDLDLAFQKERLSLQRRGRMNNYEEEGYGGQVAVKTEVKEQNPYVTQIRGTEGLFETIINQRKNSVVFVAMRSCRTCKSINPIFTKIAREYNGDIMFAKADATGKVGRALGKSLGLVSVPSFVLFKNGVRYGAVKASKLPSDRLEKAISDLESGRDFDPECEEEDDGSTAYKDRERLEF